MIKNDKVRSKRQYGLIIEGSGVELSSVKK